MEADLLNQEVVSHSPWEDLREARTELLSNPKFKPLLKTEIVSDDEEEGVKPTVAVKAIPCSATEMAELKGKHSKQAKETETKYVWRVSLIGGYRIKPSEAAAAQRYWGLGVFVTADDSTKPWSLAL